MTIKWPLSGYIVASGHLRFINVWIGAHWSLLASCQTSAFWLADRPYSGCWLAREWQLAYFRVCYLRFYLQRPQVWVWVRAGAGDTLTLTCDMCITDDQNNLNGFRFTQLSTSVEPRITAATLRPLITNHSLIASKAGPVITECELLRKEFEMYLLDNY